MNYQLYKHRNDAEIADLKAEMGRIMNNPQPYDAGRVKAINHEIEELETENEILYEHLKVKADA